MKLKFLTSKDINEYSNFIKAIYKKHPLAHDSLSSLTKDILSGKGEISKSTWLKPLLIYKDNKPILCATLAIVDRMDHILQISYFEASEKNTDAFNLLLCEAKNIAKQKNIKHISAGLNLHVNYGLGFLSSHFDSPQSFGSSYNPSFYIDLFKDYGFKNIEMVSYLTNMKNFELPIKTSLLSKLQTKFKVRKADFKNIKKEAEIYTRINNDAFKNHLFYYQRKKEEDLELFMDFKYLLKEENLLFVEYNNEPIGFMLWYPDYNQLLSPFEAIGPLTVFKNLFFSKKINKFKIVEIGVIDKFQKTGAIISLFNYCHFLTKNKYDYCEAGWILSHNKDSNNLGLKWADSEYKQYQSFILDL